MTCLESSVHSSSIQFSDSKTKRKGLQLALEPLNGQGIAGYVPEPELWARSLLEKPRPGRTHML